MTYQYRGHDKNVTGQDPGGAERILTATIDLYGRHGFDHLTLKDIAGAAGVSAPMSRTTWLGAPLIVVVVAGAL